MIKIKSLFSMSILDWILIFLLPLTFIVFIVLLSYYHRQRKQIVQNKKSILKSQTSSQFTTDDMIHLDRLVRTASNRTIPTDKSSEKRPRKVPSQQNFEKTTH